MPPQFTFWLTTTLPHLLCIATQVALVIGLTGTALENIGDWTGKKALTVAGQKLEAIGSDIPKLIGKVETLPPTLVGGMLIVLAMLLTGCKSAKTAEYDLCKARAEYKLANAAAGGVFDPKPGSPRAKLEAAEDAFCASPGDGG